MIEDIEELKSQGATQEEISAYIDFCDEWEEINREEWLF